jgi:hypothetical protein
MKITRTTWLMLALGVFVIAFVSLFVVYSHQASQHKDLESSLAEARALERQLALREQDLKNQLAQRNSDLKAEQSRLSNLKKKFPAVQSRDYLKKLSAVAGDCGLDIEPPTASGPRQQEVDTVTYLVTTFSIAVEGEMADILDFIQTLATSEDFTSATIEVVNISIPEPPTGKGETTAYPQATLSLDVYAYPGE